MTVSTTTSTAQFDPNGVTINFPFAFRFFAATDLKVFWQKPDGTIQLLVLNSNYTVQGAGNNAGGSITTIGPPLPNGLLVVSRIMVATQLTSFRNQGEFFAEIHEDAFDKLVMLVQQTIDSQGRGLTVPVADPLGINLVLPSASARAGKALAFDQDGQPVVSTLTLEQIEQQPTLALEAAEQAGASAEAAGDSEAAAGQSASTSAAAAAAAAASAQSVAYAAMQLGMSTWGYRAQPFQGFALDDGQELDRALYPGFAAALDAGLVPVVSEAVWQSTPSARGSFVANSSTGKFRMRDLNGVSAGSLVAGGAFLRGGNVGSPTLVRDTMQAWTASICIPMRPAEGTDSGALTSSVPGIIKNASAADSSTGKLVTIDPSVTARTGTQTAPVHVTGAWMTRVFGVITPVGPTDFQILSDAYSALAFGYVSASLTWAAGGTLTMSHGLGVVPAKTSMEAECTTADAGYSVGALLDLGGSQCLASGASFGFFIEKSATQLIVNIGAQGLAVLNKSTRAITQMTPTSWRLRVKASKA